MKTAMRLLERFGPTLMRAMIAAFSSPLSTRSHRMLALSGLLDQVQAQGWNLRVLGTRRDLVWGNDPDLQRRYRTLFLPDPDLLEEDEFLALAQDRLARAGPAARVEPALSGALYRARMRLRTGISRPLQ